MRVSRNDVPENWKWPDDYVDRFVDVEGDSVETGALR
jgi:hypothetical protein